MYQYSTINIIAFISNLTKYYFSSKLKRKIMVEPLNTGDPEIARNMPTWEFNGRLFKLSLIIVPFVVSLIYIGFIKNPEKPKTEQSRHTQNSLQK
jgi:hypothetical protein